MSITTCSIRQQTCRYRKLALLHSIVHEMKNMKTHPECDYINSKPDALILKMPPHANEFDHKPRCTKKQQDDILIFCSL